jgi:hypothetical protein
MDVEYNNVHPYGGNTPTRTVKTYNTSQGVSHRGEHTTDASEVSSRVRTASAQSSTVIQMFTTRTISISFFRRLHTQKYSDIPHTHTLHTRFAHTACTSCSKSTHGSGSSSGARVAFVAEVEEPTGYADVALGNEGGGAAGASLSHEGAPSASC